MKRHSLYETAPRGFRAYPLGWNEWLFLPLPVFWVAAWYRRFRIEWVRNVTAPNSRLRIWWRR